MEFVDWLQPLVAHLKQNAGRLLDRNVKISDFGTSCPDYITHSTKKKNFDRFSLSFLFSTQTITWHFVCVWSLPNKPPMIIFDRNFKPNLTKLIALNPWNPMCDSSLTKLVENLFQLYAKHQIELCMTYDRLRFDLQSFDNRFDGIEAVVLPKAGSSNNVDVNFLFKIRVDKVHCLPSPFVTNTDVEDCALLIVKYKTNFDRANVELRLPDFINQLINPKGNFKIPPLDCLMSEYIPIIKTNLNEAVTAVADSYEFRRRFIQKCHKHLGVVLDGEFLFYTRAAFLMENEDFQYILHFKLPSSVVSAPNFELQLLAIFNPESKTTPYGEKHVWNVGPLTGDELDIDRIYELFKEKLLKTLPSFRQKSLK